MSRPRYDWWGYVKGMIRRYPRLKERYRDLHTVSGVADYSGIPHGTEPSRTTEAIAIKELPTNAQREYEAVRRAIAMTERYKDGRDRLAIIKMVLWDGQYTLSGAALRIPCSYRTARRYHSDFIFMVAKNYGLLD